MAIEGDASKVEILLGGAEPFVVETYSVSMGVLTQPAQFMVQLGSNQLAKVLRKRYPAGTDFELRIGGHTQFVGRTDGWSVSGDGSGGTALQLRGRDQMAPLIDATFTSAKSFSDATFKELTRRVLDEVYLAYSLATSDEANRKVQSGVAKAAGASSDAATDEETLKPNQQQKTLQAKVGQKCWSGFLQPQLARGGLFLWASWEGGFILSEPTPEQPAAYQILNLAEQSRSMVKSFQFRDDTTARHARYEVWGRRGGGKETFSKINGVFIDEEMQSLGFTKSFAHHDDKCTTSKQAGIYARRLAARARRAGWALSYTVAGHTVPQGSGMAVWTPNTVAHVIDEELDLDGPYWIESVEHRGAPQTETTINLMRPEDAVLFSEESE